MQQSQTPLTFEPVIVSDAVFIPCTGKVPDNLWPSSLAVRLHHDLMPKMLARMSDGRQYVTRMAMVTQLEPLRKSHPDAAPDYNDLSPANTMRGHFLELRVLLLVAEIGEAKVEECCPLSAWEPESDHQELLAHSHVRADGTVEERIYRRERIKWNKPYPGDLEFELVEVWRRVQ